MILDAGDGLPTLAEARRIERFRKTIKINFCLPASGARLQHAANRTSKNIMLHNIESSAAVRHRSDDRGPRLRIVCELPWPVFRILQKPWFEVAKRVCQIVTEAPTGVFVCGQ